MQDPATLGALVAAGASVGVWHTLAGPDHYVPIAALARHRQLSRGRTVAWTVALGMLHCATSAGLAFAGWYAAQWAGVLELFRDHGTQVAAVLLVGVGVAMVVGAVRRRRSAGARRWIAVAFAVGPCEWLIPAIGTAAATHGAGGALAVCAVFTAATVGTMVLAVAGTLAATARLRSPLPAGQVAGGAIALCGLLMLVGL